MRELIAQAEALEWAAEEYRRPVDIYTAPAFAVFLEERAKELRAQAEQPAEPQGEPVAFAIRSKRDGSLFATDIAIVGWATFDSRMAVLRAHPWVETEIAEIVPLYARPDPRVAMLEGLLRDNAKTFRQAKAAIKGREHTGFIDEALERIEAALGEG